MKIILTGATGVLGSHIMYEILELFINTKNRKTFQLSEIKGK
jgi:thioester reductase-like protein